MSLCRKSTNRQGKTRLGFHRLCGGVVYQFTRQKNRPRPYSYVICGSCRTSVAQSDIVQERPPFIKQQTAGRRWKRPRYDIKSWKEVK